MNDHKKGRAVIGILLAGIVGLFSMGAIISTTSKPMKATKIVKTINHIEDTVDLSKPLRKENNESFLEVTGHLSDVRSTIDAAKTINDVNEISKKTSEERLNRPIQLRTNP